jgi:hypothetical protein
MAAVRKLTPADAQRLVDAGKSPRSRELERLQAYYDGTQYAGLVPYLDLASGKPRFERAPCIKYPLAKAAIESNVALAMGGQRFPRVLSMSSENDALLDGDFGLSQPDSETLDAFNAKLIELCGLADAFAHAYRVSQASRSGCLVLGYRNGLPSLDVHWPAFCTPTFNDTNPAQVDALEIRYRYIDRFRDLVITGGQWWPIVREYRRVIDGKNDTVFKPKDIWDENDLDPTTQVQSRNPHGFGFCPVVWYARQRPCMTVGGFDGVAVHDGKLDELDAINHALSSRHLAAMYCGDPITTAFGFNDDDLLGTAGRSAQLNPNVTERTSWDDAIGSSRQTARIRKGPGELMRSENADASVAYVTLPADALDAIDKHAQDIAAKIREALRYVWLDPTALSGAGDISGKTLAFVFSSQLHAVSQDRGDFGRNCLLPTLATIYRALVAKSDGVYLPGLAKALPIIKRFLVDTEAGPMFIAPQLYLKWGDFFEPSDTDEATRVSTATAAATAGLITKQTAVEHVRDVFAIGNVDQYVDALEEEALEKQQKALESAQAMAVIKGPPQPGDDQQQGAASPPAAAAKPAAPPIPKRGLKPAKKTKAA